MLGRRLRGYDKEAVRLMQATFDGFGDRFGSLPGSERQLTPGASHKEIAQAFTQCGTVALAAIVSGPPVAGKEKAERKRLLHLAKDHPDRALDAAVFLTHAICDYVLLHDEVSTRWSERLDFETAEPATIQYEAQAALREHLPLPPAGANALRAIGDETFRELEEIVGPDPELDFKGAFGVRCGEFQLHSSIHAAEILRGCEGEELQLTTDAAGFGNPLGVIKVRYLWRQPERTYLELLSAINL